MTDAPERIWAKTNAGPMELENWYLKEPSLNMTEYIRADLHADLLRAADKLAKWVADGDGEGCLSIDAYNTEIALVAAYKQAKEKLR